MSNKSPRQAHASSQAQMRKERTEKTKKSSLCKQPTLSELKSCLRKLLLAMGGHRPYLLVVEAETIAICSGEKMVGWSTGGTARCGVRAKIHQAPPFPRVARSCKGQAQGDAVKIACTAADGGFLDFSKT